MPSSGVAFILDLSTIKSSKQSPNQGPLNSRIQYIVIHTAQGSFNGALSWLCNPKSKVSAHYLISKEGKIVNLVPIDRKAWHVGSLNSMCIGIENEGDCTKKDWITSQLWEANKQLCAALCKELNLPPDKIIGHNDEILKRAGNTHSDPGKWWNMPLFRQEVGEILNG